MPIFSLLFFKHEKFQKANSTVSRVCYKYCIPLQNFRKILVNCLKEKLKTLLHMIVFLKHDQLIQTEGLIENFTHALNFANCYVESRQCQTFNIRHLHISHNAPYSPHPSRSDLHDLCFSFLLGVTAVPREIENNAYAKFWGQIRCCVWCIMGDVQVANSCAGTFRPWAKWWILVFWSGV